MSYRWSESPFDNIENSHHYVSLLAEAIDKAAREIQEEIAISKTEENSDRRTEALQIVAYNLAKLSTHMTTSRRILNDLRSLRRLLAGERKSAGTAVKAAGA